MWCQVNFLSSAEINGDPDDFFKYGRQLVFPNLKFNCNGSIMSWNYAFSENGLEKTEPPEIQLWSVNNINPSSVTYSIVDSVTMMSG